MTVGTFFYHVVIPAERTNLLSNPSFELGTAGYAGTASATLGTLAAQQAFGVWALTATGATDGLGATLTTPSLGSGSAVTASAYVRVTGASGGSAQIAIGGTSSRVSVGSAWQRVSVGTVQTATATRTLAVQRYGATGAAGTLWVDGVQAEYGSITTYIDGDQEGCQWLGAPHASLSYRSGQSRAGGSVIPLAALGLRVETHAGVGMAQPVNLAQSRAVLDGAEYQRTRADVREFTLTATMTGTTVADLHQTRRRVIDALKVDRTTPQAPTRFLYTGAVATQGAAGTVVIDAVYAGGLDITDMQVINDNVAARFTAFEPLWRSTIDEGAALAPYTALGSVNYIAARDPLGRWGTMGASGTTFGRDAGVISVRALEWSAGTLFVGGVWGTAGGTLSRNVALWANGAWGSLGGSVSGLVNALLMNPGGTLFVGGTFEGISGTDGARNVALWANGAFGTLVGGTPVGPVNAFARDPQTNALYAGGSFTGVAGTAGARYAARWNGAAWGTLVGGTVSGTINDLEWVSGTLYAGGRFTTVAGTTTPGVAFWTGAQWGTIVARGLTGAEEVYALAVDPQQRVYAGGARLDPYRVQPGGSAGLTGLNIANGIGDINALVAGSNNVLWAAGAGLALYGASYSPTLDLARWNGYSWLPPDLLVATGKTSSRVLIDPLGTVYVAGAFNTIGTAASVTPVVNTGMSDAYPILRVRNTGAGTARVFQLLNATTGDDLYFNLVAAPGEYITLDLTPGNRAFTSTTRGNLINTVIAGSNLATWRLQPGTNWVSFFSDGASVRADLYWRPRHWSVDGGAEASL